jgi:hypothetical protein
MRGEERAVTDMNAIRVFFIDYFRLMTGRRLLGFGAVRSSVEKDARTAGKRFSRGNVSLQVDRAISESDLDREYEEVAKLLVRN